MKKINLGTKLNAAQLKAVKASVAGAHTLIASAGTGKSSCLVAAAHYIVTVTEGNCSILALSFTKKTTADLMQRMSNVHGNIAVATIHSFFYRVLRSNGYKSFTFLQNEAESKRIIKKIIVENGYEETVTVADVEDAFCKNYYPSSDIQEVVSTYLDTLKGMRKFTYDSLQYEFYELITSNAAVASRASKLFSHVLIDEAQDLNSIQAKIIKRLWKADSDTNIVFAGDPLQSIYGFRGSKPNVMEELTEFYSAEVHKLTLNYRCFSHSILDLANAIMPKAGLKPTLQDNGIAPVFYTAKDSTDEANYVVDHIKELHNAGKDWSDMLILFRSCVAVEAIYEALVVSGIPFVRYGGDQKTLWSNSKTKRILGAVSLLNEKNNHHWIHCIAPVFGIDSDICKEVEFVAGKSLAECILAVPSVSKKSKKLFKEFLDLDVTGMPLAEQIKLLWDKYLKSFLKAEDDELLDHVLTATSKMQTYDDLRKYFTEARRQERIQARLIANNLPHIRLMTAHTAKGIEAPHVFVVGLQDGLWPDTGHESTDIDEENRLLFVAITRARESLTLSYVANSAKGINSPCRFLKEYF